MQFISRYSVNDINIGKSVKIVDSNEIYPRMYLAYDDLFKDKNKYRIKTDKGLFSNKSGQVIRCYKLPQSKHKIYEVAINSSHLFVTIKGLKFNS